jgi:hypothetical protein
LANRTHSSSAHAQRIPGLLSRSFGGRYALLYGPGDTRTQVCIQLSTLCDGAVVNAIAEFAMSDDFERKTMS